MPLVYLVPAPCFYYWVMQCLYELQQSCRGVWGWWWMHKLHASHMGLWIPSVFRFRRLKHEKKRSSILSFILFLASYGCLVFVITDNKLTILVVMHHTFNPDLVVAESKRLVEHSNVRLVVDCLFYEDKFLRCNRNDIAWYEIQRFFGVQPSRVMT